MIILRRITKNLPLLGRNLKVHTAKNVSEELLGPVDAQQPS